MGFANLTLGVLGILAISRRDGFRTATILATTIIGLGFMLSRRTAQGQVEPAIDRS